MKSKGFTLAELLVVIALIGISAAAFIPLSRALQNKNDITSVADIISQNLRRAQALSQSVDGDTTWGVHFQTGSVTLFQGPNYIGRNINFDEVFSISPKVNFTGGIQEVVYSKLKGEPNSTGNINISLNSETKNININAKGILTY